MSIEMEGSPMVGEEGHVYNNTDEKESSIEEKELERLEKNPLKEFLHELNKTKEEPPSGV